MKYKHLTAVLSTLLTIKPTMERGTQALLPLQAVKQ